MHTRRVLGTAVMTGSVAEWSKALVLGTSLSGRGFESHRCQSFCSRVGTLYRVSKNFFLWFYSNWTFASLGQFQLLINSVGRNR